MARIALISDVHLANHSRFGGKRSSTGLNQRCLEALKVLGDAVVWATEEGADAFFVLGDLFDSIKPPPQLIAETQRILSAFPDQVVLLVGNHEQATEEPGNHALGPLSPIAEIVDQPRVLSLHSVEVLLIPYRSDAREVAEIMKRDSSGCDLICVHQGIDVNPTRGSGIQSFLAGSRDALRKAELNEIPLAAGHWHDHRQWEAGWIRARQLGALVPPGFRDPGFWHIGYAHIYDTSTHTFEESHQFGGPRFIQVRNNEEMAATLQTAKKNPQLNVYVEWTAPGPELAHANEWIRTSKESGEIAGGGALPDKEIEEEKARKAARAAASAETLEEAMVAYVEGMELPEGVIRERVLELAQRYLRGEEDEEE
jgi:calcineurin-like phosphoesterase family protein